MKKTESLGTYLPFLSVLLVTKVMTDDFQVYLYDETHSNSTHVSLGKNKTCDWAVLASGWMMMEFTTLRYKLSLFSVS